MLDDDDVELIEEDDVMLEDFEPLEDEEDELLVLDVDDIMLDVEETELVVWLEEDVEEV